MSRKRVEKWLHVWDVWQHDLLTIHDMVVGHVAMTWTCGIDMGMWLWHGLGIVSHECVMFGQCDGLAVSCLSNAMRHEHT